ncbi:uncharacterized protein LOC123003834 isoform X2 [Tribolium madens]|uniref:uncharacterized protein LOC123003834 isoform X2 n=1 Tax=Tribolium madens TaxID=41895 RepID=UPI001CF7277C|nr:uncharacterized protein LOC123003834 isoform X2 [Tribolium madens]
MHLDEDLKEDRMDFIEEQVKFVKTEKEGPDSKHSLKISTMKMKIREKLITPSRPVNSIKNVNILKKRPQPGSVTINNENKTENLNQPKVQISSPVVTNKQNGVGSYYCVSSYSEIERIKAEERKIKVQVRSPPKSRQVKTVQNLNNDFYFSSNPGSKINNFRPRKAAIQFNEQHLKNPFAAKQMWKVATSVIEQQRRIIKNLETKNEKLCKRIKLLEAAFNDIQNSSNKSGNCYIILKKPGNYVIQWS